MLLVIGVDPGTKNQGIALRLPQGLDRAHTRSLNVTSPREIRALLASVRSDYPDATIIVAIEEWTVAARGEKTTWNVIQKLERIGERWSTVADLIGLQVERINSKAWQKAYRIRSRKPKAKLLPGEANPTTKEQSVQAVRTVFGITATEDLADAILIADYIFSLRKFTHGR